MLGVEPASPTRWIVSVAPLFPVVSVRDVLDLNDYRFRGSDIGVCSVVGSVSAHHCSAGLP